MKNGLKLDSMSRKSRKRAKLKQQRALEQSIAALKRNGKKAFDQAAYADAIETWQRALKKRKDSTLNEALGEAYFRLAMKTEVNDQRLTALQEAATYQPNDERVGYHIGLTQLRLGLLKEANVQLARVKKQPFAKRAAFPLAVTQTQLDKRVTQRKLLSADQLALLDQLSEFQRRPYQADSPATLRGFVAYDNGEWESAEKELSDALTTASPDEQAVLHKYLGNIAAQKEQWAVALTHWQQAAQLGLQDATLDENLGEIYHRLAEEALEAGNSKRAGQLANEAHRFKSDDNQLNSLLAHLQMQQGNAEAQAQQWREAVHQWEMVEKVQGGSFRLAYNLSLAYEKLGDHELAAEKWREVLRRRPRSAGHVDALNDDEVAQIWKRAAEAYIKDEQYDEALTVYRSAIKYDSENLPLRMAFAEAALTEGHFQTAENELDRILEQKADYIPALMLLGEVRIESSRGWWGSDPTRSWQRVLEIDPNHQEARNALADFHLNEIEEPRGWFYAGKAEDHVQKALEYAPNRPDVLYQVAIYELDKKDADYDIVAGLFDRLLQNSGRNLEMYGRVLSAWLIEYEDERAEQVIQLATERKLNVTASLYVSVATFCYRIEREDIGPYWAEKAKQVAKPDEPILSMIGEALTFAGEPEAGRDYLQQALQVERPVARIHYVLGVAAAQLNDMKTAKREWLHAERVARRHKDSKLLDDIEQMRMVYDSPFGGVISRIMRGDAPPELLEQMMDEMEDDDGGWY